MNSLVNRVQLIGALGNDPEVKNLESGNKLAKFRMATNEYKKNAKGERVDDTQWHNVIAWGKTAEIIEKYAHKGSRVCISGKLNHSTFDDKDGNKKYFTEVVANEVLLMDKAPAQA